MMKPWRLPVLAFCALMVPFFAPAPAEAGLFDLFKQQQVVPPGADPTPPAGVGGAYDGQSAPMTAPPAPGGRFAAAPGDAALRMDRMEQQMRQMTGQIEELTFQLNQLQAQIRALQSGGGRPGRLAGLDSSATPPRPLGGSPAATSDSIGAVAAAPAAPPPAGGVTTGAPPRTLGQIPAVASGQPADPSALPAPPALARSSDAPSGDARNDYDAAYDHVLKGDYMVAQSSFQIFLANYPGDPLAPDAQYWIGDSFYQRGDYRSAADAFLTGYQKYPKSGKAPDMLLKLGLSLAGLGQREAACGTYAEIFKKYPKASNALLQRVKAEQASASC